MTGRPSTSKILCEQEYVKRCAQRSDINELLPILRAYGSECAHITEFGTRHGNSTYAWVVSSPRSLVCYDVAEQPDVHGLKAAALAFDVEFSFHLKSTLDIQIAWTDLLFIDTLHTYQQVQTELRMHGRMARKWIILHDTETFGIKGEDEGLGIMLAVSEWLEENLNWYIRQRFYNCNGLVVLERDDS